MFPGMRSGALLSGKHCACLAHRSQVVVTIRYALSVQHVAAELGSRNMWGVRRTYQAIDAGASFAAAVAAPNVLSTPSLPTS